MPVQEVKGMSNDTSKPEDTTAPKPFERRECGPEPRRKSPEPENVDDQLDEALDESFPASDPPSPAAPKP